MKLPIVKTTDKSWFWLWGLPVLSMVVILVASQMGAAAVEHVIVSPFGLSENLPTIFLAIGVAYAIAIARRPQHADLRVWMIVYAIALVYFAGEDQNWFQYWLGVTPPDYFLANNREQEINLHNINGWFNQKPRMVVELWALIGCVLVPMGWWLRPKNATRKWVPAALWPDRRIVPIAVISLALGLMRRGHKELAEWVSLPDLRLTDSHPIMLEAFPGVRISELEEIGFAYLMMLFVALLYGRLATAKKKSKKK